MSENDFDLDGQPAGADSNAPAYSVSELAFALKRTLEEAYGFVRLRAELSKVTHHANGHVYLTLKDDKASLDGVVWKGQVSRLSVRPEHGLEVVVTGRITTYPAGSRYQIVIDSMEAAGVGALLAQLERLKARLTAEGLFDSARKRSLPPSPAVIGVITSPTGAVIRDILHRVRERWPCRVLVWPVVVQGDQAAATVTAAITGFNALMPGGAVPRPDVLIVARGGGSVEDLWPFNDEGLARAVAASAIPLISAVGHETDTTLIDFASDCRAPTPTAAAEMATPVLAELRGAVLDFERRMLRAGQRLIDDRRLRMNGARLPRKEDLTAIPSQRLDHASSRLAGGLRRNVDLHANNLARVASPLKPGLLRRPQQVNARRLNDIAARARPALDRRLSRWAEQLTALDKLRQSYNPDGPLARGFARIHGANGNLVRSASALQSGDGVQLVFADGERGAVIDGDAPAPTTPAAAAKSPRPRTSAPPPVQGDLF